MTMTKLEAVNIALDAIGETSVNTLSSGIEDAETAERMLGETTRSILSEGWLFNTRVVYLTPDTSGRFVVPGNALSIDTVEEHGYIDVIADGGYLTRTETGSNVWTLRKLRVEIVYSYDFEALPFTLRDYIAKANAVKFQKSSLGSVSKNSLIYGEYLEARTRVLSDDNLKADPNMLRDNPGSRMALYRNNRLYGQ